MGPDLVEKPGPVWFGFGVSRVGNGAKAKRRVHGEFISPGPEPVLDFGFSRASYSCLSSIRRDNFFNPIGRRGETPILPFASVVLMNNVRFTHPCNLVCLYSMKLGVELDRVSVGGLELYFSPKNFPPFRSPSIPIKTLFLLSPILTQVLSFFLSLVLASCVNLLLLLFFMAGGIMANLTTAMAVVAVVWWIGRRIAGRMWASAGGEKERRLPPGSMGWPYIGETFQLYSNNPNIFFAEKQRKYGAVFKTHILGCPCVMVSSPEAARFVLVTKAHLFKPTFPASKERMLGPQAIFFQRGEYHARLRRLVLRAFMPDAIRAKVPGIEEIAIRALSCWDGRFINTYQEMKTYALNVALLSIFGKEEQSNIEELKQCYYTLEKGYNSMPVNLPGTLFHKAMKARRQLGLLVAKIISSRRERDGGAENLQNRAAVDLLASFMDAKEALTDDQIADNIIGVMFAARDTTASVLTWILKYLAENPSILEAVAAEQEDIRRSKKTMAGEEKCSLNWADTKVMPITCRVIQETMRVASVLSFTFRETVQDVEYDGYLIPKGWKVLPLFRNIHHSPENFPNPEKFDPSRFEVAPKQNTYLPFGNGTHACPGNELAKLEMLVLLHHLTTQYRWSLAGFRNGIQFGPFVLPLDGLPIKIDRLQEKKQA